MANIQELCLAGIPFTDDPFYPLDLSKLQRLKSLDLRQVQACGECAPFAWSNTAAAHQPGLCCNQQPFDAAEMRLSQACMLLLSTGKPQQLLLW